MTTNTKKNARPRFALMTNHGYGGVQIPVGGAPDTGGQNFYVNTLALSLERLGFDVTIFARGGFTFFGQDRLRQGTEQLREHVRYVYVPGGGDQFIPKEDIAFALDEETLWLSRFICAEAREAGVAPWNFYECFNTHYWDAAIIAIKLVERWQDQIAHDFLRGAAAGVFAPLMADFSGDLRHQKSLSRELFLHTGRLAQAAFPGLSGVTILGTLLKDLKIDPRELAPSPLTAPSYTGIEGALRLGEVIVEHLAHEGEYLPQLLADADTHVWTPHSLGILKERNFWNKDAQTVRRLKFRERNSHEETICEHTPLMCSTSPEIWQALVSYHGVEPPAVFDFPPCVDEKAFRPRSPRELEPVYAYLAEQSGLDPDTLKNAKIIFETSRMDHTKRKDLLLEAFAQILEGRDDAFLFIGGGPTTGEVFSHVQSVKSRHQVLEGRAFLLGYIPEEVLAPLFSAATLFASASEMEGFGMSASQAAAAGVAIICSDLVPFATQYAPDCARVVPAGDVDGFAAAMGELLDNGDDRRRRAKQLLTIAGDLNWDATSSRFVDWYRAHRSNRGD